MYYNISQYGETKIANKDPTGAKESRNILRKSQRLPKQYRFLLFYQTTQNENPFYTANHSSLFLLVSHLEIHPIGVFSSVKTRGKK